MKKYSLIFLAFFLLMSSFVEMADHRQKPTIFMIGDSTMANKSLEGANPERGWGQMLPSHLSDEILVDNHAVNGRSSKSFIDEGRWQAVLDRLQPGDYVFIQFGHNDEKPQPDRHTDPGSTFDDNLRRFVNETRAKGGIPVLFNSIVRRNFGNTDSVSMKDAVNQDDTFYTDANAVKASSQEGTGPHLVDTHGDYLLSPRNVAAELNVPFVDMNQITKDLVEALGPEDSKRLFMWVAPNTVPAIPKGREDNTHLNVYGARVVSGLAIDAIAKAVPELSKYVRHYDFVVAKDGSGDFFTVQEAVNAVPDFRKNLRTTIMVRPGEYKEKLIIPECKINLALIGQPGAVITYDGYASKLNSLGSEMSTSGSATCYIYAPDFYADGITFENSAGPVGQAVACFVSGDRAYFNNCRFLGNQDTLYTYGDGDRQYYKDCYIEGTVDFIFGWSKAVFDHCVIHSKGDGYISAPSTSLGQDYGYVFYDCVLSADEGVDHVYLSRPWRPYAQAVFIGCQMGDHVLPVGWDNWGNKDNELTVFYGEYGSYGPGAVAEKRAPFAKHISNPGDFAPDKVLCGSDGWAPAANGPALINVKK